MRARRVTAKTKATHSLNSIIQVFLSFIYIYPQPSFFFFASFLSFSGEVHNYSMTQIRDFHMNQNRDRSLCCCWRHPFLF